MQALLNAIKRNGLRHSLDPNRCSPGSEDSISGIPERVLTQQVRDMLQVRLPGTVDERASIGESAMSPAVSPLSDIQYAYLIGRNGGLELGGIASCLYFEWDLDDVDVSRLEAAFNRTVEHHPVLRAILREGGQQEVLDAVAPYSFSQEDARTWSEERLNEHLQQTRRAMETALRPLDQPTSFDIRITRLTDTRVRMHTYFDLMFLDVPSVSLVLRDWWQEYRKPGSLQPVGGNPFGAYLHAEQVWREGLRGEADRHYWTAKMDDLPPAPELPLERAPALLERPVFHRCTRVLDADILDPLATVAHRQGLTLETILLGAYAEVLQRWSRHPDFTLTVTQAGRRSFFSGVDSIAGNFLQPELLAVTGNRAESLIDRWIRLQTEFLLNRWHSSYNGVRVLRDLTRRGEESRIASAPIVFSNTLTADLSDPVPDIGWECARPVYSRTQTPQVWLENQIVRENGDVHVHWNHVAGLFPAGMIERMLDQYMALLNACVEDAGIWQRQGSAVALPDDDRIMRQNANDTAVDFDLAPLHALFLHMAEQQPDAVAVIRGGDRLTYGALLGQSLRLAERIRGRIPVERNDILAVSLPQGPELLVGVLGILFAGAAYVAVDPAWPERRRDRVLARCAVKGMVGDDSTFPACSSFPELVRFTLDNSLNEAFVVEPLPIAQALDDLAYVIFTSGSTGDPKGVMVSHRNAANTVLDINRRFEVSSRDAVLSVAPAGFDLSVYDYFGLLAAGGRVVFPSAGSANDPHQWARDIAEQGVTVWNSVPAPMKVLVDQCGPELSASTPRLILMSGDWIPVDLPGRIRQWLPDSRIISLGGATEGSIWSICFPIDDVDAQWHSIPYGRPLANQAFHVLNPWMDPCPQWVTGELYIAGTGVAQGYLGDPEKTSQRFVRHPETGERLYKTGDLGRYIDAGLIEILGREDSQVKVNGYRVELGEIEACLLAGETVDHVVVDAPLHPKTAQRQIVAYVVPKSGLAPDTVPTFERTLRELAQRTLPGYMVPAYMVALSAMPLTPNGKIDRKALPSPWAGADEEAEEPAVPENELERRLLSLWQCQLEHQAIEVTQGFFDVGGDSLHAVGLLSAIRESFDLPDSAEQAIVEGLFMNASIRTLAGTLEDLIQPERVGDS